MSEIDLHILKQAILDYRKEGEELMILLGIKFGYDISVFDEYSMLIARSNDKVPMKGQLSKRWNFAFHGGECSFFDKKSKLDVDVILSNPPKFGSLDAWFLMNYMESNEKYNKIVEREEWLELEKLIQILYDTNEIIFIKKD